MLRHSSSFIVSLLIHVALAGLAFSSYKYVSTSADNTPLEKRVCVPLCCVVECEESVVEKVEPVKKKVLNKPIKKVVKKAPPKVPKKTIPLKQEVPKKIEEAKEPEIIEEIDQKRVEEEVVVTPMVKEEAQEKPTHVKKAEENLDSQTKERKTPTQEYVDENLEKIIKLLQENLYYPRQARKRGIEGEVFVRFHLSVNAEVSRVEVLSSKSTLLSRAAIETIENISGKFPSPKESLTLSIPITYSLKQAD